ncbi:type I-E CRISPR-associated protein Cse1/CasA [Corynebacterium sp. TAE3-ERU2]|nr:type I-E CRISPR-associated protein Cse1/CasA [Corynebacterium sp. TAE3-ERU2]
MKTTDNDNGNSRKEQEVPQTVEPEPRFNLIDEPWMCCRTAEGTQTLSIRDVFDGSASPISVLGDSPTQDYAVLRVLLSIYWRAHHHALEKHMSTRREREAFSWPDWVEDQLIDATSGSRDEVVLDYLESVKNRFYLFHPTQPFMQVSDLHKKNNETNSFNRLIPEAEHSYFSMRAGSGQEKLDFAEAARWLIHTHAWDYSGIKSGAVGDPRVKGGRGYPIGTGWTGMTGGTVVCGATLRETLVLNTTPEAVLEVGTPDLPVWERKPDTAAQRASGDLVPTGPVDLATWQSRRVRLFREGTAVTAVLVSNGDRIPDAGKNIMLDPMTPYRYSPNQSKKGHVAYYAKPYDTSRTMWRAIDPLLVLDGDPGFSEKKKAPKRPATLSHLAMLADDGVVEGILDVSVVSMEYGDQNSSVSTIVSASVGIPLDVLRSNQMSDALRQDIRDAAARTEQIATALGAFAGNLLVASGGDYEFGADAADRFYADMEPRFIEWIRRVGTADSDTHVVAWQKILKEQVFAIAEELVRSAGPRALIGRTIGADDSGSGGRIISAATAYDGLRRKVTNILNLLSNEQKTRRDQ